MLHTSHCVLAHYAMYRYYVLFSHNVPLTHRVPLNPRSVPLRAGTHPRAKAALPRSSTPQGRGGAGRHQVDIGPTSGRHQVDIRSTSGRHQVDPAFESALSGCATHLESNTGAFKSRWLLSK